MSIASLSQQGTEEVTSRPTSGQPLSTNDQEVQDEDPRLNAQIKGLATRGNVLSYGAIDWTLTMKKPFVPENFIVPLRSETPGFILRKLTTGDVKQDYEAVMSSKENLRTIFRAEDDWPRDDMTLEENFQDLKEHQEDFDQRRGFTYTVLTPSEDICLGCLYIYPWRGDRYDAQVYFWVRDSAKPGGLEKQLDQHLRQWLAESWPFQAPAFPGREIPWDIWEGLQPADEDGYSNAERDTNTGNDQGSA